MARPRKRGNKSLPQGLYRDPRTGTYSLRHPVTGRGVSLRTKDESEARQIHAQVWPQWQDEAVQHRAEQVMQRIQGAGGGTTAAGFAAYYRAEILPEAKGKGGAPLGAKTRRDYDQMLQRVEAAEDLQIPLEALEPKHLRRFLAPWIDSPAYYNYLLALLARVYAQAVREGRIDRNPAKEVERLAPPKRETYLPDEAYSRIMAQLPAEWMVRAFDLIYLLSERPSDVLGLQDRNVDWGVPSVWLEQSKTGQPIEIVMNDDLVENLRWFKGWKKDLGIASPYLVCTPKGHRGGPGRRVRAEYLSKAFAQAVKDAGYKAGEYKLKDLRPKSLTDEFVEAGDSEKGGHRTERMKRYYRRGQLPMKARTNVRRVT